MRWIWQQPDWPNFRYDNRALDDRELEFRINSERLVGRFEALPMACQEDATIDLMLSEAIKTSAIEGEDLDRESVRSSLLSLITSDTLPDNLDQKAAGLLRCWWTFAKIGKHRCEWNSLGACPRMASVASGRGAGLDFPWSNEENSHSI